MSEQSRQAGWAEIVFGSLALVFVVIPAFAVVSFLGVRFTFWLLQFLGLFP